MNGLGIRAFNGKNRLIIHKVRTFESQSLDTDVQHPFYSVATVVLPLLE